VSKFDVIWLFDDKTIAIHTTAFSALFITFRIRLKVQWFDR